jgi:hypothetical protein
MVMKGGHDPDWYLEMTTTGQVFESQSKSKSLNDSLDVAEHSEFQYKIAGRIDRGQPVTVASLTGQKNFQFGEEMIFDRIWIDPVLINPTFITEDVDYDVEVWNAYLDQSATWTTEVITGDTDGVSFARDPLTITILKGDYEVYVMTVLGEGPAVQDTTYTETILGDAYTIDIETMRVIGLDPEPNWISRVQVGYSFETVLSVSDRHVEQRRPLRHDLRRTLSIELIGMDTELHKLSNLIQYGHDKVFACPVFQERVLCTGIPNGGTSITTLTDTTNHWNLNNACSRIMIADHAGGTVEIKNISAVAANTITTSSEIAGTFDVNSTMVYPIFVGTMRSHRIRHLTNTKAIAKLQFEEYIGG